MRIICLVMLIIGCGVYEEESEVGFITHEHVQSPSLGFLITKVHRPYWVVGYFFGDRCGIRQNENEIKSNLRHYLRVWLAPLKKISLKNKDIVDVFRVRNIQTEQNKEPYFNNVRGGVDLVVKYTCEFGTRTPSYAMEGGVNNKGNYPPFIVMRTKREATLLHELGHTIGLMDTYAFVNLGVSGQSHDYFERTIGNQPPSIMSSMFFPNRDSKERPVLSEDDKKGIKWLYLKYFTRKIDNTNKCYFPGYELELLHRNGHKGCVPSNPLMFLVKNGYTSDTINRYLSEKSIQQLLNKKEKTGNQLYPLHYLAAMPNEGGWLVFRQHLILSWQHSVLLKHADLNVTDRRGQTPLHYAIKAGNTKVVSAYLSANFWGSKVSGKLEDSVIDENIKLPNGMTYLHFAIQHAQIQSVCLLLMYEAADQTLEDRWGLTPVERANSRVRFWRRKGNQQKVKAMKQIISLFDSYESNSRPVTAVGFEDSDNNWNTKSLWVCGTNDD